MTGKIQWDVTEAEIKHSSGNTANRTIVRGGYTWNDGSSLYLHGKDYSGNQGTFEISAHDGTNYKTLKGQPDGTLTWNSKNIVYTISNGTFSTDGVTFDLSDYPIDSMFFLITTNGKIVYIIRYTSTLGISTTVNTNGAIIASDGLTFTLSKDEGTGRYSLIKIA